MKKKIKGGGKRVSAKRRRAKRKQKSTGKKEGPEKVQRITVGKILQEAKDLTNKKRVKPTEETEQKKSDKAKA